MRTDIVDIGDLLGLECAEFVRMSYHMMLGRRPDPNEFNAHTSALRLGHGRPRLLADIARSPEYQARQAALSAQGDDAEFVTHLYLAFLGRRPDPGGLQTYLTLLRSGRSRDEIRDTVSRSAEARFAGTVWSDLRRLLDDEKKRTSKFGGWFGRSRGVVRARNRDLELAYSQRSQIRAAVTEAARNVSALTAEISALSDVIGHLKEQTSAFVGAGQDAGAEHDIIKTATGKIELSVERASLEARQHRQADIDDGRKWRVSIEAALARIETNISHNTDERVRARHRQLIDPANEINVVHLDALGSKSRSVILRIQTNSRVSTNPRDDIDAFDN